MRLRARSDGRREVPVHVHKTVPVRQDAATTALMVGRLLSALDDISPTATLSFRLAATRRMQGVAVPAESG